MKYHFEQHVAIKTGVEEAIMLSNIEYWVEKNAANGKHFYDGSYWTYNSKKAFAHLFPFWSEKQVRRILEKLIKLGYLKSGNYNQKNYDKTLWYTSVRPAFLDHLESLGPNGPIDTPKWAGDGNPKTLGPNGPMDRPKQANGTAQMGQPIPDNKPDIKQTVNVNGSKKKGSGDIIRELPTLEIDPAHQALIAETIARELGDHKSQSFYQLVAARIPEDVIIAAVSSVKNDGARNGGAVFTHKMRQYAEDRLERGEATQHGELQAGRLNLAEQFSTQNHPYGQRDQMADASKIDQNDA